MEETTVSGSSASIWVEICGGDHRVLVRPWTLAQREELRPLLADLILRVSKIEKGAELRLERLFLEAESELFAIVRASVQLPDDMEWGALWWEDLPSLAQAVWQTSVVRGESGGLLGKVGGVLSEALLAAARGHAKNLNGSSPPDPGSSPNESATQ